MNNMNYVLFTNGNNLSELLTYFSFFFFFFNNMNNNMNCSLFTCSESVCPSIAYSSKAGFLF